MNRDVSHGTFCEHFSRFFVNAIAGGADDVALLEGRFRRIMSREFGIMSDDEPQRLPLPPFWRTRYFAFDVMPRRPELDPAGIRRVIARPERRVVQGDGRIRLYGFSASLERYLRLVLLCDGETVHNAFPDEGFAP